MITFEGDLAFVLIKSYTGDLNYTKIIGVFSTFELANKHLIQLYNEELDICSNGTWLQGIKYDESTNTYKFFGDDADILELKIEAYSINSYLHLH
jgi:hypothetical protein|nr:MAG TPA: hypothetical protein [Caudoviricetes sp.]